MKLLNIQDNKANLHMMHNLTMAQVAMRQLQRNGHTVVSIDPNGVRPVITIEPPLNGNVPLCAWSSTRNAELITTGHLYHCQQHIADVKWSQTIAKAKPKPQMVKACFDFRKDPTQH